MQKAKAGPYYNRGLIGIIIILGFGRILMKERKEVQVEKGWDEVTLYDVFGFKKNPKIEKTSETYALGIEGTQEISPF